MPIELFSLPKDSSVLNYWESTYLFFVASMSFYIDVQSPKSRAEFSEFLAGFVFICPICEVAPLAASGPIDCQKCYAVFIPLCRGTSSARLLNRRQN